VDDHRGHSPKTARLATKSSHAAYFLPMLESLAARNDLNEIVKNRVVKSCELLDAGIPLYPNDFRQEHSVSELSAAHESMSPEELDALDTEFSLAGRVVSLRSFGKAAFFHLADLTGRIQCYAERGNMGEEYASFRKIDIGDIVGVAGRFFRTKTGELTINCRHARLLAKSIRQLPEKHHGLKDVELRYRQRYVDLIMTPRTRELFLKRSRIVGEFRKFMEKEGFLEVETPMMQPLPGGATARPFSTHHNALDMRLYLRVAPELYLKRLLVGGFEKVFELNRNFRNEGISTQHNPEFTMAEFYWAYVTYIELMDFIERLFGHLAEELCGSRQIIYQGRDIDLAPGKWRRMTFYESLEELGGHAASFYNDHKKLRAYLGERGEKASENEKLAKLQAKVFDLDVEPKLVQPHFIYHYPLDLSPLSRRNAANPQLTDRFELFITGREMANAFSELNDPMEQRSRFEEQMREREGGDEEAHSMDEDYLRALEYAMPPAGGVGIGVDRLVMLLTDAPSIREVILFPLLKPEA
jgi:lysyl-tRNA synthetase class 2